MIIEIDLDCKVQKKGVDIFGYSCIMLVCYYNFASFGDCYYMTDMRDVQGYFFDFHIENLGNYNQLLSCQDID